MRSSDGGGVGDGPVGEKRPVTGARELLPGVPLIHSPFFEEILATSDWDAETRRVATDLNRDGFAVIDFPEPELDALAEDIIRNVHADLPWDAWRRGELNELQRASDAWRSNESVRRLAANAKLIELLGRVYGREAFPFQTLNFPIGSQQSTHIDLVHFASAPENFMCGVWLALEDIQEGAGPLRYYPGSHRWPVFYNEHIGRAAPPGDRPYERHDMFEAVWAKLAEHYGAEPVLFHPRKGQALIWAAGLHHGGAPHTNRAATRFSQVTHYFFKDCAYYTPFVSNPFAGRIGYREGLPDVRTGRAVPNVLNGTPVPQPFIAMTEPPLAEPRPGTAARGLARRALRRVKSLLGA